MQRLGIVHHRIFTLFGTSLGFKDVFDRSLREGLPSVGRRSRVNCEFDRLLPTSQVLLLLLLPPFLHLGGSCIHNWSDLEDNPLINSAESLSIEVGLDLLRLAP
mmetsp:Transcript_32566/g.49804  ORF Transcript_32566/g.49804 Transcript_32566/m.49804 type:complete len:104 (-) Transcript_32566:1418-1729(-)